MRFDLTETPFSMRGSYMAVSWLPENFRGGTNPEGLYLRTVHGAAETKLAAKIDLLCGGKRVDFDMDAGPHRLRLSAPGAGAVLAFADRDTLLLGGYGRDLELRLDFMPGTSFDFAEPVLSEGEVRYLVNKFSSRIRYMLSCQKGSPVLEQQWEGNEFNSDGGLCRFRFRGEEGELLVVLEEVMDSWEDRHLLYDVEDVCRERLAEFEQFRDSLPSVPEQYREARETAAYVDWSSTVSRFHLMSREGMMMSKNWMCGVWSWDHCFNAIALAYGNPKLAWDQFMIMFDHQTQSGRIPDGINDSAVVDNFCKPPIHGWTLRKLRDIMNLSREQLEEAWERLEKWTLWWLRYRDQDGDGLCEYLHGNDSGWDNSTAFLHPPVTLPDLAAFLILQMEELADVASLLGREEDARTWKVRSEEMLERMLGKLFPDGRPAAMQTVTGEYIETESLILYLPVILGNRLPEQIRTYLIRQLESERFHTPHGLASESPASPRYEPDSYWRGPVWASAVMLIADGLWQCGEKEFVRGLARSMCENVEQSGCAENFNALTGDGLRDRAYTWTASVMLVMAHEYLMEEQK